MQLKYEKDSVIQQKQEAKRWTVKLLLQGCGSIYFT